MNNTIRVSLLITMILAGSGAALRAQSDPGDEPRIDPRAESIVRKAGKRIQGMKHVTFEVADTLDVVLETGQKLQYAHRRTATMSRPDRLTVESTGDVMNLKLCKDGTTITLLDKNHNVYAQTKDPGTIDQMMDMMLERFGVSTPMADLICGDPADVLLEDVESGLYLGIHNVDEHKCHHIACTREDLDWQAWIDTGANPLLRKLLITYKKEKGEPQYTLKLLSSTPLDSVPAAAFQFKPPAGCEKIDFLPITADATAPNE
jgi:hypothetical protein